MAIELLTKANVDAPDATWVFGKTKDRSSPAANDGTPLNQAVMSDYFQFFAKMFFESGLTFNALVDNETNGFQYFDALKSVIGQYKTLDLYGITTALTADALGALSVAYVAGNTTITLPPLTADLVKQKIHIFKQGSGICTVIPDGSDVIQYAPQVFLSQGDMAVFVAASGGIWFLESNTKTNEKPPVVHTTSTVNLSEKHLDSLNIINYAGTATYTLPPVDALSSGKLIFIEKQQGGIATILPYYTETIVPSNTIKLDEGDTIVLESTFGLGWVVISQFDASMYLPDDTWQAASYTSDWKDRFGLTYPNPVNFKLNKEGKLIFKGEAQSQNNGTTNASSIAFTLPVNYRPSEVKEFIVAGNAGATTYAIMASINIDPSGVVTIIGDAAYFKWVSFDSIIVNLD